VPLDFGDADLTTEVIRTERLLLRPYRPADEAAVFDSCQDPEIQRWLAIIPSPYTRDDARAFVTELAPGDRASGRGMPVAMEADGVLVGSGGLHFWPGRLGPEIGYWVAPGARGNGYAAEAARALAGWALAHGAPRVHLWVDVDNAPSQAAARQAGFTREGVVRSVLDRRDGSRADAVLFGRILGD
jgi:RimJ/RimL family protein N-acetyltransferase